MEDSEEFMGVVPSSTSSEFNNVSISSISEFNLSEDGARPNKRVPKRVLQFSDGILEEFSSDEDEKEELNSIHQVDSSMVVVDPRDMTWVPFLWYQVKKVGSKTLSACDYLGEHIADFFGITSPKYQYEIEEYFRMKTEEDNERKKSMEMESWGEKGLEGTNNEAITIEEQPSLQDEKERGIYYNAVKTALKKIKEKGNMKNYKVGIKPTRFY